MKLLLGKLDYSPQAMLRTHERTAFLFTGNSTIKANGALVMGRGAALAVRDLYPGIDLALGRKIERDRGHRLTIHDAAYGVIWLNTRAGLLANNLPVTIPSATDLERAVSPKTIAYTELHRPLAIFQVKFHYRDNARLDIIEYSAFLLGELARRHPDWNYVMNYPGIGAGHLTQDQVQPILSKHLPDNVVLHV